MEAPHTSTYYTTIVENLYYSNGCDFYPWTCVAKPTQNLLVFRIVHIHTYYVPCSILLQQLQTHKEINVIFDFTTVPLTFTTTTSGLVRRVFEILLGSGCLNCPYRR